MGNPDLNRQVKYVPCTVTVYEFIDLFFLLSSSLILLLRLILLIFTTYHYLGTALLIAHISLLIIFSELFFILPFYVSTCTLGLAILILLALLDSSFIY